MPVAAYNNPYRTTKPVENSYSRLGSPFGWKSPMSQPFMSGRSYLDPSRMEERGLRMKDRLDRQGAANYGAGGGRGGGGGGRGGPQLPMPRITQRWSAEEMNDQAMINFGNMPSLGQDYASALARTQNGMGGIGDYGLLQQRLNPSVPSDVNNARARQQWRQFARSGSFGGGLAGAAQQALFG